MPHYLKESRVWVAPFTRQLDGQEFVIGLPETGTFLALPVEAIETLDWLSSGLTIGQVAQRYNDQYSEELDIEDFLIQLDPMVSSAP